MGITDEAIEIEYWHRPDGGWSALCLLTADGIGVTVAAPNRDRLFTNAVEALDRFWEYAGRQAVPGAPLRLVMRFRGHPLRFHRVPAPREPVRPLRSVAAED